MKINLHQIKSEDKSFQEEFHSPDLILKAEHDLLQGAELKLKGKLQEISGSSTPMNDYLLTGTLEGVLQLTCCRCLVTFDYPCSEEITEVYRPASIATGKEFEEDIQVAEKDQLDTEEVVLQALLLSIPWQPLCNPDCQGLCPKCGKNLNEGACECAEKD